MENITHKRTCCFILQLTQSY